MQNSRISVCGNKFFRNQQWAAFPGMLTGIVHSQPYQAPHVIKHVNQQGKVLLYILDDLFLANMGFNHEAIGTLEANEES